MRYYVNMKSYLNKFLDELIENDKAKSTVKKYEQDLKNIFKKTAIQKPKDLTKEKLRNYFESTTNKVSTKNNHISVINTFLKFHSIGFTIKKYRQQENFFEPIIDSEYEKFMDYAIKYHKRTAYIVNTFKMTGIRVSELKYLTVESLNNKEFIVFNKGKTRQVLLSDKIIRLLKEYCRKEQIKSGRIFINHKGAPLSRSRIHDNIKYIALKAKLRAEKFHAHTFRHYFAFKYMQTSNNNLVELKDLLGHENINTTAIYAKTHKDDIRKKLNNV